MIKIAKKADKQMICKKTANTITAPTKVKIATFHLLCLYRVKTIQFNYKQIELTCQSRFYETTNIA